MTSRSESSHLVTLRPRRLALSKIAYLVAPGAIVQGLVAIVQAVTFGSLLLPGDDLTGIFAWMISVVAGQAAAAAVSRLPSAVAGGAIELLPIYAHLTYAVRGRIQDDHAAATATALAGCALLSLALAAWYYVVDRVGGSQALRFFPVSALTGALAGVGVFLALEAHGNVHGDVIQFCVALTLAVALTVGEKQTGSTWFVLAVLVAAAVAVGACGLGDEWYYALPGGTLSVLTYWERPDSPAHAHWWVLMSTSHLYIAILSAIFVHQLSTCMDLVNVAGVGAKTSDGDGDLVKSELRTFAAENCAAGLCGAPPNYMPFSALYSQTRAAKSFPKRGMPPKAAPVSVLLAVVLGAAALPFVARRAPRCVVAAYLLWLAWLFIEESLVASLRNRPHPLDLLVILVVPILTLTCGFVVGLGLGIVLSSLGLVVRLGATPAARAVHVVLNGADITSNLHRDGEAAIRLSETADRRLVVSLQGLLSFATTPGLIDDVSSALGRTRSASTDDVEVAMGRMARTAGARVIIVLDFARVSDVDDSATRGLLSLKRIAHDEHDAVLLVAALPAECEQVLARAGFFEAEDDSKDTIKAFEYVYGALEYAESLHLRSARRLPPPPSDPAAMLRRTFAAAPDGWFHCIESAFEIVDVEAGETIWNAGDPASGIALVVSGRLRTSLRSRPSVVFAGGHDREVEPSGPGSLHGYLSAFTGHSHHLTFTALTDARLLVISKARLDALPATAMLAVARVVMARSSHEYRHHTAVVANLMQCMFNRT